MKLWLFYSFLFISLYGPLFQPLLLSRPLVISDKITNLTNSQLVIVVPKYFSNQQLLYVNEKIFLLFRHLLKKIR